MNALDRDKARAWLIAQFGLPDQPDEISDAELDALEACVVSTPEEGITLSPEEARTAASALRNRANELRFRSRINPLDVAVMGTDTDALRNLAKRLESAS